MIEEQVYNNVKFYGAIIAITKQDLTCLIFDHKISNEKWFFAHCLW